MTDCLNNYKDSEISNYFAESDESLKKCNKCPNEDWIREDSLINKKQVSI